MIRIICTKCKNAYLQNKGDKLVCPSCEATYEENMENLLLGVQYYNEENFSEADNCLMKYIVQNGAEPKAVIYKALLDARNFDEDTVSLEETYKKILDAFADVADDDYPEFIALANDETEKIERLLCDSHVRLFADADAEKIKKQVETILNIQKEAKAFRLSLTDLVIGFNERSSRKISAKFSDCFFVESDIAEEVGNIKYQKICDNVASHTVFTGILTNDIKNLEIYLRCIVMFFEKSHDKYDFLLKESAKFTDLAELLNSGRYNTIKGIGAIADKLKAVSYEFLEESYKEHFDEQIDMQTETVVVIEPEIPEEPEVAEETEAVEENVVSEDSENTENTEIETAATVSAEEIAEIVEIAETSDVIEIDAVPEETTETQIEDISSSAPVEEVAIEEVEEGATEEVSEDSFEETEEEIAGIVEDSIEKEETDEIVEETAPESTEEITETVEEIVVEEVIEEEFEDDDDSVVVIEEVSLGNAEIVEIDEAILNGDDQKDNVAKPKKKKSHKGIVFVILVLVALAAFAGFKYVPGMINGYKYEKALELSDSGKYSEAIAVFEELGDYEDSAAKAKECAYNNALKLEEGEKFAEARVAFENLGDYEDAKTRALSCAYNEAKHALDNNNFDSAVKLFTDLGDYGDSKEMIKECSYKKALSLMDNKEYDSAIEILTTIKKYSDSKEKINEAKYMYITDNFDKKNKKTVKYLNELTTEKYRNCAELREELLGSAEVLSADIKTVVNYSATDIETSLTQLDNTKPIYFHAIVKDKSLYGQTLTMKYKTGFGYTQRKTVTLSESDNVAVMSYPATSYKNYTVEFELLNSDGNKVAGQKISF